MTCSTACEYFYYNRTFFAVDDYVMVAKDKHGYNVEQVLENYVNVVWIILKYSMLFCCCYKFKIPVV